MRVLSKSKTGAAAVALLPLGSRGQLDGRTWEVAGYALRSDGSGEFHWQEYLLVNARHELRWLVENQGHWSLGEPVENKAPVGLPGGGVRHRGLTFQPFLKGHAKVVALAGGFPWPIKHGEVGAVADFISPPWMLSREGAREGTSWTLNRYVPGDEIRTAFSPDDPLPPRSGVAPNQPFPAQGRERAAWLVTGFVVLLLLAVQGGAALLARREEVLRQTVLPPADPAVKVAVLERFTIPGGPCAVLVRARSGGAAFQANTRVALQHEGTPARHGFGLVLRPVGASGSLEAARIVPEVPGGTWSMVLTPAPTAPVEITVTADVPVWRNFWITALLVVFVRFGLAVWGWSFEASRWSQSDVGEG